MDINFWAVLLATIAQFIIGAIWYMPVFGSLWGKIHGFEKYSKKEQTEMQKGMAPLMVVQFLLGGVTAFVMASLFGALPGYSVYMITLWLWIGFVVPTQTSAVVFGGTAPRWVITKTAIMAGGSLACMLVAAFVISIFG